MEAVIEWVRAQQRKEEGAYDVFLRGVLSTASLK